MPGTPEISNPGVKYLLKQTTAFLAVSKERLLTAKNDNCTLFTPSATYFAAYDGRRVAPASTSNRTPCASGRLLP